MAQSYATQSSPLPLGKTLRVAREAPSGAFTRSWTFIPESDAVLVSLYVISVSGTLDLAIWTQTEDGKDILRTSFPTISSPTTNLVLKKGTDIISQVRLELTTSGAAEFEIYAKAVPAAEASIRVLGADTATATQTDITTTPSLLVPVSLSDRSGLIIKNNNSLGGSTLYIGFSPLETAPTTGYPITAQESLGMDLSAGVSLYARSSAGTSDIRILQAGS